MRRLNPVVWLTDFRLARSYQRELRPLVVAAEERVRVRADILDTAGYFKEAFQDGNGTQRQQEQALKEWRTALERWGEASRYHGLLLGLVRKGITL
jgi:hypothetical protein